MNQEALFERAQNGELSQPEQEQFNQRCQNDPAFNSEWQSYKYFLKAFSTGIKNQSLLNSTNEKPKKRP